MNIFIHYLDKEVLDCVWMPKNKLALCAELEMSIKIAILLSDAEIYVPFSNYCESEVSKNVLDRFTDIMQLGIINLISSSPSFEDFLNKKHRSYAIYQLPQIQDNISNTIEGGIPGIWRQRHNSATVDIGDTWINNISDNYWESLYSLTKYKKVSNFENGLFSVPQKLEQAAFVASNVIPILKIKEGRESEAKKYVNTKITQAYISSYLDEFNCICFKDMHIQGMSVDALLPEQYEHVSYVKICRLMSKYTYKKNNLLEWIKKCNKYQLFEFKNSDIWKEIVYCYSKDMKKISDKQYIVNKERQQNMKTFIVHGHDAVEKLSLKNYIQNTLKKDEPIILAEVPSQGRTVIEKFEDLAGDATVVFVLLTPDDVYGKEKRARQNVIFELGYFLGKLGRTSGRVVLLYKGDLDLPSDISGVIYINIDNGIDAAGEQIRKEISQFL